MRAFKRALLFFILFSVLTGLVYPFLITGLCQLIFPYKANGSLIVASGKIVGSDLIGQNFTSAKCFNGRPSALEKPYDASNSAGSNFGPSNAKFLEEVEKRIVKVRQDNGLRADAAVPADLVLASGSGLDPHISLDGAMIQVPRVAKARKLPEAQVLETVEKLAETPFLGLAGQKRVNVVQLNLALDALVTGNRWPSRAAGTQWRCRAGDGCVMLCPVHQDQDPDPGPLAREHQRPVTVHLPEPEAQGNASLPGSSERS